MIRRPQLPPLLARTRVLQPRGLPPTTPAVSSRRPIGRHDLSSAPSTRRPDCRRQPHLRRRQVHRDRPLAILQLPWKKLGVQLGLRAPASSSTPPARPSTSRPAPRRCSSPPRQGRRHPHLRDGRQRDDYKHSDKIISIARAPPPSRPSPRFSTTSSASSRVS